MKIIAYNSNPKNFRRYHQSKGLFNKRSMRIAKRNQKTHKKSALKRFCGDKIDTNCITRALRSNKKELRKSANFALTLKKIASRRKGIRNKFDIATRKKNDAIYNRKHKTELQKVNRARLQSKASSKINFDKIQNYFTNDILETVAPKENNSNLWLGGSFIGRPLEYLPYVYRGISNEEWNNIQKKKYIKSDGRLNLSNEKGLTVYSINPNTALNYANDFIPDSKKELKPTKDKPNYIVQVDIRDIKDKFFIDKADGYVKTKSKVPIKYITRVWEVYPNNKTKLIFKRSNLDETFNSKASNKTIVYHGSNANISKLEPKYMMLDHANSQEGVGIYFTTEISTAKRYGKNIYTTEVEHTNFISSRTKVSALGKQKVIKLLKELGKLDRESAFYLVTDYGVYITEPEEYEDYMMEDVYNSMRTEQIRNFQIELSERFSVVDFVNVWNKVLPKVHGTYILQKGNEIWYSIINTKYKIKRVN